METKELENYILDIVNIENFNEYYHDKRDMFSEFSLNAFLKTLDIPPKFFKEQPIETQKELLDNREVFVRENKKYFNKVIVVVTYVKDINDSVTRRILGAERLSREEAEERFEQLKSIDEIPKLFLTSHLI